MCYTERIVQTADYCAHCEYLAHKISRMLDNSNTTCRPLTHFVLLVMAEKYTVEKKNLRKKIRQGEHILQPRWVLQGKNRAAQFFIEKYLSFQGGDFATPLLLLLSV